MYLAPLRLQTRADHRLTGTFAIGSGDVDHRWQAVLRVAKRIQQPPNAVQCQIDHLGVQGHHPLQDDVRTGIGHFSGVAPSESGASICAGSSDGGGSSPLIAGGRPNSIRVIEISSSRIWGRGVTRSSMP